MARGATRDPGEPTQRLAGCGEERSGVGRTQTISDGHPRYRSPGLEVILYPLCQLYAPAEWSQSSRCLMLLTEMILTQCIRSTTTMLRRINGMIRRFASRLGAICGSGWMTDSRLKKRRKLKKFVYFSILLPFVPIFTHEFPLSELYVVAVGILLLGSGEMMFDREHHGKAGNAYITHICLSLVLSFYGSIVYGEARTAEAAKSDTNSISQPVERPVTAPVGVHASGDRQYRIPTIPPVLFLILGIIIGASATYFSETPARRSKSESVKGGIR